MPDFLDDLFYTGPEMIECPLCGRQLSNQSPVCPNCAQPMNMKNHAEGVGYENGHQYSLKREGSGCFGSLRAFSNSVIGSALIVICVLILVGLFIALGHH